MGKIGVIANPASGKDIRRLVGQALVIGNQEKVNVVKRILIGAQNAGVDEILIMPDFFGIGRQSIRDLRRSFPEAAERAIFLEMPITDSGKDSTEAARMMGEMGADCILTLGGDGTVRVVSKGAGKTPLIPISTGTNNVIPAFVEGTIAGMAAATFSNMPVKQRQEMVERQKKIEIYVNGKLSDIALVDTAVIDNQYIGSRAVWKPESLLQVAVTQASPDNIGFTSIIGRYRTIRSDDPFGGSAVVKEDGKCYRVQAAIGPGLIYEVCVDEYKQLFAEKPVAVVEKRPCVLALDGEREIVLKQKDTAEFILNLEGPYFVNIFRVLESTQPQ